MFNDQRFFRTRVFWIPATLFLFLGLLTLASALGFFQSDQFLPHATCYLRNPRVIALHVSSDLTIGLAYLSISITLGYLVRKARKIIPFQYVFLAFGLFIITCGFTHLMEVITVWRPYYWLAGYIKIITALASMGTAIGLVMMLPKIFTFISAAQAAEQRRVELTAVNEELNAFAYSVSHDLRAPLRAVQGMSSALKEDFGDSLQPEAKDYLDRIVVASARMDILINDLLQYSRISRTQLETVPVDVGEAIKEALASLSAPLAESQATVAIDQARGVVLAHKTLLVQVLANLIGNAIKFVPAGRRPEVTVTAESLGGMVRISVTDNGIGIAPEYQEKIFRIFERLHPASEYSGTGIGLAIVQRAVIRMKGRLGLESTVGQGTTFWFELPGANGK